MSLWTRAPHADVMSEQEVQRAWPRLVEALSRPAKMGEGVQRSAAMVRVADLLKEVALQGMSLDAAPYGSTVAHLIAGFGDGYTGLLNQVPTNSISCRASQPELAAIAAIRQAS